MAELDERDAVQLHQEDVDVKGRKKASVCFLDVKHATGDVRFIVCTCIIQTRSFRCYGYEFKTAEEGVGLTTELRYGT